MQNDNRNVSRDGLDEYIKVCSPGLLIVVGALLLMLAATVIWGFTGKLPVTVSVTGCVVSTDLTSAAQKFYSNVNTTGAENQKAWIVCYVDSSKYSAEELTKFDEDVTISMPDRTTFTGKISYMSSYPLNRDEASLFIQDGKWVADQCVNSDYSWGVIIQAEDDVSGHLFTTPQITIVTDEVPPIRFLTR